VECDRRRGTRSPAQSGRGQTPANGGDTREERVMAKLVMSGLVVFVLPGQRPALSQGGLGR